MHPREAFCATAGSVPAARGILWRHNNALIEGRTHDYLLCGGLYLNCTQVLRVRLSVPGYTTACTENVSESGGEVSQHPPRRTKG